MESGGKFMRVYNLFSKILPITYFAAVFKRYKKINT